ncbi:uncharacterized protein FIBRA_04738 [Fibroporia radiculosa]|uniref:laccase n=1 Tax=Fibroporia radiculosa TaxID=599839 RepID=J4H345_9APHY|nr:uncharacterized protein FIBRA_04738 [Fibroporia radiculosa]CCM02634.1 predicted protein [Fibroporia radiculosa]
MLLLALAAGVLLVQARRSSIGPVAELALVNANVTPDGFTRLAVLPNGLLPGPPITGYKGDNFKINVHNYLTDHTMNETATVHWHGIYQHGTNWADGTSMVSQCPLTSGDSFLYDFSVPDQAGTFWYHSHEGLQYCDGLRGPFIVYDPHDPHKDLYDVDDDNTIITLFDWYHEPALEIPLFGNPDSILINGMGRSLNDSVSPLSVITVTPGLRYRFRLISMSCNPYFNFTIDGHNFTIIEADGQNTQPLPGINFVQIHSGQRYSFILEANQPIANYWIRAPAESESLSPTPPPQPGMAILRYRGAPEVEPETKSELVQYPLIETNLHALTNPAAPGVPTIDGADVDINLNVTFNLTELTYYVNDYTFAKPPVPILLQILSGKYAAQDLLPAGAVYTLPRNKTIQVTMPGGVFPAQHPMHLHGSSFSVIKSAGTGPADVGYNFVDPVRRDTVNIGLAGDFVTIRFDTHNPGPWMLHCHIDFHLYMGYAIVFAEDPEDTRHVNHPPPAWNELCPKYDTLPPADT